MSENQHNGMTCLAVAVILFLGHAIIRVQFTLGFGLIAVVLGVFLLYLDLCNRIGGKR